MPAAKDQVVIDKINTIEKDLEEIRKEMQVSHQQFLKNLQETIASLVAPPVQSKKIMTGAELKQYVAATCPVLPPFRRARIPASGPFHEAFTSAISTRSVSGSETVITGYLHSVYGPR